MQIATYPKNTRGHRYIIDHPVRVNDNVLDLAKALALHIFHVLAEDLADPMRSHLLLTHSGSGCLASRCPIAARIGLALNVFVPPVMLRRKGRDSRQESLRTRPQS